MRSMSQVTLWSAGGQVELTGISGAQISGGAFFTVKPLDLGLFGSVGWMSGENELVDRI